MDQNKLLECLEEIKSIAQSQQNQMTKEEIHQYLSDMELHEDQFDAVYQYLATQTAPARMAMRMLPVQTVPPAHRAPRARRLAPQRLNPSLPQLLRPQFPHLGEMLFS